MRAVDHDAGQARDHPEIGDAAGERSLPAMSTAVLLAARISLALSIRMPLARRLDAAAVDDRAGNSAADDGDAGFAAIVPELTSPRKSESQARYWWGCRISMPDSAGSRSTPAVGDACPAKVLKRGKTDAVHRGSAPRSTPLLTMAPPVPVKIIQRQMPCDTGQSDAIVADDLAAVTDVAKESRRLIS